MICKFTIVQINILLQLYTKINGWKHSMYMYVGLHCLTNLKLECSENVTTLSSIFIIL